MVERYLTSQRDAGFKVSTIWGSGPDDSTTETAGIQAEGLTKQEMDKWLGDDWPGIDGG
ncbi:hypothetical protein ACLI1R_001806 [Corynebacterium sp. LaCa97]|uniref:hypothetical protein n=1 Tax=Corynebacterium sp. LaCa97 TaxID=3391431 RepID=UPI003988F241